MTTIADYVLRFYPELMTDHERAVCRHLTAIYKSTGEPPEPNAEPKLERPSSLWVSKDADVLADAAAGWVAARERIAQRMLRDQGDHIFLNHCPKCGSLTRTPKAKLCLTCGYSWHEPAA